MPALDIPVLTIVQADTLYARSMHVCVCIRVCIHVHLSEVVLQGCACQQQPGVAWNDTQFLSKLTLLILEPV